MPGPATSRQQLLPIDPGRAARSPHAPASVTAGERRPATVPGRLTAAHRHGAPHPFPLAWWTRATARAAVGGAAAM
jgi:hypothetical protein